MPPKKQEPSKKTEVKKKEKIVEDKTFGMKNKKGAKQQKFIQTVQQQVSQMGKSAKQIQQQEKEKLDKMSKKDEKKKAIEELNTLFKPVEQKVGKGTDPKSVLCAFFKSGQCTKGDKCKFSHDLTIERKAEKRSLYEDQRDEDTMDNWDEAKLEEVVNKKHGESNKNIPRTEIICKYFLEAVETSKYGWFWSCPKGENCIYRHALPPGFALKKDQKKEDKGDQISLEDLIEKERAALSSQNLTRVTLESFLKWKEKKRQQKIETAIAATEKKKTNFAAGKLFGISGRELFEFNPDLVGGDDEEADDDVVYEDRDEESGSDEGVREVNLDMFAESMSNDYIELPQQKRLLNDGTVNTNSTTGTTGGGTGTGSSSNGPVLANNNSRENPKMNGDVTTGDEEEEEEEDGGGATGVDEPIDENLFDGEDLDLVEEELENLEVES